MAETQLPANRLWAVMARGYDFEGEDGAGCLVEHYFMICDDPAEAKRFAQQFNDQMNAIFQVLYSCDAPTNLANKDDRSLACAAYYDHNRQIAWTFRAVEIAANKPLFEAFKIAPRRG